MCCASISGVAHGYRLQRQRQFVVYSGVARPLAARCMQMPNCRPTKITQQFQYALGFGTLIRHSMP